MRNLSMPSTTADCDFRIDHHWLACNGKNATKHGCPPGENPWVQITCSIGLPYGKWFRLNFATGALWRAYLNKGRAGFRLSVRQS
jgi:hypothetical protein